jgi:Mg/Co/Ni transporter MgtE
MCIISSCTNRGFTVLGKISVGGMKMELNEEVKILIDEKRFDKLKTVLKSTHPVQIASLLGEVDTIDSALVFRLLEKDIAIEVFEYLDVGTLSSPHIYLN